MANSPIIALPQAGDGRLNMSAELITMAFSGVSAVAVCVGVVFAMLELRHMSATRREQGAVGVVQTVQTQEVRRAIGAVLHLPIDADSQRITGNPEMLEAALAVDSACEMWGCMVFEGIVDHKMLDRMVGGWVRGSWERLRQWVYAEREATGNPNVGEWWEWLYMLLEADPDAGKAKGAHVGYRAHASRRRLRNRA